MGLGLMGSLEWYEDRGPCRVCLFNLVRTVVASLLLQICKIRESTNRELGSRKTSASDVLRPSTDRKPFGRVRKKVGEYVLWQPFQFIPTGDK